MIELDIDPRRLRGVNALDNCKLRRIACLMMERGWEGRRLLVEAADMGFFAWTGSHRIAAALLAGLDTVPCAVLTQEEADAAFVPVYGNRNEYSCWRQKLTGAEGPSDRDRLRGLQRAGLVKTASILQEEIDAPEG